MLRIHRAAHCVITSFFSVRHCTTDIRIPANALISRKKNVPPLQLQTNRLKSRVEQVTSDLLSNSNVMVTADSKSSILESSPPLTTILESAPPITTTAGIGIVLPSSPNMQLPESEYAPKFEMQPAVTSHDTLESSNQWAENDATAVLDVVKQREELLKLALPFDEVPGPLILKYLAQVYSYLPLVGMQITAGAMMYFLNMLGSNLTWNRSPRPFIHMFDKYGPLVRLQGIFGGNIVFVSRPEHIETVFRQEGHYPIRSSLDSIEVYRQKHRKTRMLDPFIMSGSNWESLRFKLETPIQKVVPLFYDRLEFIADEMINRIYGLRNKQEEVPATFDIDIYKWALENVCMVTLGKRMGLLDMESLSITSESIRLLEAMQNASYALRRCESGFQLWRFIKTRNWRALVTSCDIIDSIVAKYIRTAQTQLQNRKNELQQTYCTSLLEMLLVTEDIHPDDILTIVLDMFLIGVNATSHALGFLLYHLSKNPRTQHKAYDEVIKIMPTKDSYLNSSSLDQLHYLKACLKESLRLQPPIPVIRRVLPHDIALHGYRIPKETYMLMTNHVTSLQEENFEDALKFRPERWLSNDQGIHPFATIPFGYGPRSCVGKGLAELQLWLLAAKIIRNFRIEYHYGHIKANTKLISMPSKPLKFCFVERSK